MSITGKQFEMLAVIDDYWTEYGIPPTYRDIADLMSGSGKNAMSTSVVNHNVGRLAEYGYIERREGIPRSITITPKGYAFLEGAREWR